MTCPTPIDPTSSNTLLPIPKLSLHSTCTPSSSSDFLSPTSRLALSCQLNRPFTFPIDNFTMAISKIKNLNLLALTIPIPPFLLQAPKNSQKFPKNLIHHGEADSQRVPQQIHERRPGRTQGPGGLSQASNVPSIVDVGFINKALEVTFCWWMNKMQEEYSLMVVPWELQFLIDSIPVLPIERKALSITDEWLVLQSLSGTNNIKLMHLVREAK
uniref:Uncharacterized protein n=1 Tax=Chenopodium quinoa TaxID=63459 RepID=A0A803L7F6_CHEQI